MNPVVQRFHDLNVSYIFQSAADYLILMSVMLTGLRRELITKIAFSKNFLRTLWQDGEKRRKQKKDVRAVVDSAKESMSGFAGRPMASISSLM